MAPAEVLGASWLLNPIVAAFTVWGLYAFLRRSLDEVVARITAVLLILSPFALFMSASHMNHTRTLGALLLALLGLAWWSDVSASSMRRQWGAIAVGGGIGLIAFMRPYDAVLVALPVAVFQMAHLRHDRSAWKYVPLQLLAGTLPVALMLAANSATGGHPLRFGYDLSNGVVHRPGFHVDPEGDLFTPGRGLLQTSQYLVQLNRVLLEWPFPVMLIAAASLLLRRTMDRWEALLIGITLFVTAGYWAYWHAGNSFGPRFLYIAIPLFLLVIAQAPRIVAARLGGGSARFLWVFYAVCCVIAWVPVAAAMRSDGVWMRAASYRHGPFPPMPNVPAQLARANLENSLVFVRDPWHARLAARLRALGLPALLAGRIASDVDACALQQALDREAAAEQGSSRERLARVQRAVMEAGVARRDPRFLGSATLSFIPGRPLTPECEAELRGDEAGTTPLDLFLHLNDYDADGRLGGRVVFVRDLGALNLRLRERFGDRRWYVYRRDGSGADAFTPYSQAPPAGR
jgi:hypothetical protein